MAEIDQRPPEQTEPLFRFVAFAFRATLRWSPLPKLQTRELRAYPRLIHMGGTSDQLLKNVTDLCLSKAPTAITVVIYTYLIYFEWFFGGIHRPFHPDRPWLWAVMILYSVLLLTRVGSRRCIQVTYANDPGEERTAYLFPLNETGTRRDSAIEKFLQELREVVLADQPNPADPAGEPSSTHRITGADHSKPQLSET